MARYARKTRKRRRTRSRTRRNYKRSRKVPPLWPTAKPASLKYGEYISWISPVGVAAVYNYSCNGLFDPNISGTGAQPRGFDQIMPFYDHYVVIGARMSIVFQNQSEHPVRAGIMIRDVSSSATQTPDTIQEYRHKRMVTLDGTIRGGKSWAQVSYKVNPNKFLHRSHPMSDDQLKGSVSTNPSEQCFFQIFAFALDGVSDASVVAQVKIDYAAVFLEPKLGTGS